jgi:tetratricopeptide (TPR) repeat protein
MPCARADDDPDTEVAKRLFRKGGELYVRGDYQRALEAFTAARQAKPLPAFDFNIGRCEDRLAHWAEALAAYERFAATATSPEDRKEAEARIPVLRERVKNLAAHAASDEHYRRAIQSYNSAQYDAAIAEFHRAFDAVPDPSFLYEIGQAHRLAGHRKEAIAVYQDFLARVPKTPLRAAVLSRLVELKAADHAASRPFDRPPDAGAAPVTTVGSTPPVSAGTPPTTASPATTGDHVPSLVSASAGPGTSERLRPVQELIRQNRAGFRACFDSWLVAHPGVAGKVALSFYLDPDGNLSQPEAETRGFDAPEVAACIVAHARSLSYPAAQNGKYTRFSYPFDFKP